MEQRVINPWSWQDQFGFVQANQVSGYERVLVCSGQTSVDENGAPLHEGDMLAQAGQALDNLETVLRQAGMTLKNVVRLNYYTTDVDGFFGAAAVPGPPAGACRLPACQHPARRCPPGLPPAPDRNRSDSRRLTGGSGSIFRFVKMGGTKKEGFENSITTYVS